MKICLIICGVVAFIVAGTVSERIFCYNYTVGCNFDTIPPPIPPYPRELGDLTAYVTKQLGCWCQNAGDGPSCPAWLTCPPLPVGYLIILGYDVQTIFQSNACHCQCKPDECPEFPLPYPNDGECLKNTSN